MPTGSMMHSKTHPMGVWAKTMGGGFDFEDNVDPTADMMNTNQIDDEQGYTEL